MPNRNIPHVARMERFAVLRARYPHRDFDELMAQIHDEEMDAAEERAMERESVEDSPCLESCDTGTGEGRWHGLIS